MTPSSCQITFVHISSIYALFPHFSTLIIYKHFNCVLYVDGGGATSGDQIIVVVVFVIVVVVVVVVVVVIAVVIGY